MDNFTVGLKRFDELTLKELLSRLEGREFTSTRKRTSNKPVSGQLAAAIADTKELYERATDADLDYAEIQSRVGQLNRFNKADVLKIAEAIGIRTAKTKKAALERIRLQIEQRKDVFDRTGGRPRK